MLSEKTILVTGAAGLLGSLVTEAILAQRAKVIAVDLSISTMSSKLKNLTEIYQDSLKLAALDITNEMEVKQFFLKQENLSGAINCTYPRNTQYGTKFLDVNLDSFNENISLHLGSSFLFMQQCAAQFIRQNSPMSVVNVSSIYGVVPPRFSIYEGTPMTMPVEYAAIKSALLHLSKYVTAFVKDSRFRVNNISPGGIFDHQPTAFLEAYKKSTHGHGMLSTHDLTGSILFLLSEQSQYVTGQNIIIDDGFTL